jgi:hypothetical protein
MMLTDNIPMDSYKKKFLSKFIETEPFYIVSTNDVIGKVIIHEMVQPVTKVPVLNRQYNDSLRIGIPEYYYNKYRCFVVTDQTVVSVNKFVDELFKLQLRLMVPILKEISADKITNCLFEFMDLYDLTEDDIAFETLRKYFYRFRKKTMKNNYTYVPKYFKTK